MTKLIEKALVAKKESKHIEFKAAFDIDNKGEWCEILKDIFALANCGGGVILFGVDNKGVANCEDVSDIIRYDLADIVNKIFAYTGQNYADIELTEQRKDGNVVACMRINEVHIPLIPIRPGTYEKEKGKQGNAFSTGVIYYRHGSKSESANSNDIADIIDRKIKDIRKFWLGGIRKVVKVTPRIETPKKGIIVSSTPDAMPIRLTDDVDAPGFRLIDPDKTHPYRLKEFIRVVNELLSTSGIKLNIYDIQTALRVYKLETNIEFTYKPKYGTRVYSLAFAQWIVAKIKKDKHYFRIARSKYRRMRRGFRID